MSKELGTINLIKKKGSRKCNHKAINKKWTTTRQCTSVVRSNNSIKEGRVLCVSKCLDFPFFKWFIGNHQQVLLGNFQGETGACIVHV